MTTTRSPVPSTSEAAGSVSRWVVGSAVGGTVAIALGAFWLSFTALADLARRAGIPAGQAWVWPLIVDGITVVATISVVALAPHGRRATWYPWTLLVAGATISVAGNATHAMVATEGDVPELLAAVIASVPPLVLLAITHLTVELTRRTTAAGPDGATHRHTSQAPTPASKPSLRRADRRAQAQAYRRDGWTNTRIAKELGVHPSTIGRWLASQ
ncbi:DUF2637 domain-containing protein [Euzebya sp.]|uniref:DUF2637 domain-containing protein n=1 Tax=Euzebya sp. TaxID=1971409 RepID=UPI003517DB29